MDDASTPPAWVQKRDGRLEPFDADKISRALFAASESLGRPDAFLARELTDGAVHFLTVEADTTTPTTIQIAELVCKVVRELGQPALAAAYEDHGLQRTRKAPTPNVTADAPAKPADKEWVLRFTAGAPLCEVLSACTRDYTLQTVFARDLVAAQTDGLLTLTGLEAPGELASLVLGPPGEEGLLAALEQARRFTGGCVVLDGPEHVLARCGMDAATFVRELQIGLRLTGLRCVVNLNAAASPPWAGDLAGGPLFAEQRAPSPPDQLADLADALIQAFFGLETGEEQIRIDWHLAERDFTPAGSDRLARLARAALDGAPLAFVFDRARRPVLLAEGVDRLNPAALLTVGVHLPRLAEQPGVDGDPAKFLKKLGSLARLALSAAVQKRDYLRRREHAADGPAVTQGFLLDRARLVVAPVGLDAVVQQFTGNGLASSGLDFGKQIVQSLRDVLRRDGGLTRLPTCLDGPAGFHLQDGWPTIAQAAGLTPWDETAPMKSQLRAAGALQGIAEGGTATLFLSEKQTPTAENVAAWLRSAWKQADVARVRLLFRPRYA